MTTKGYNEGMTTLLIVIGILLATVPELTFWALRALS